MEGEKEMTKITLVAKKKGKKKHLEIMRWIVSFIEENDEHLERKS